MLNLQISTTRLDIIRQVLVSSHYNKKKEKDLETIGKLIYDAVVKTIPEYVMNTFTTAEADYINYCTNSKNVMYNEPPKYFMVRCNISLSWWAAQDILQLISDMMHKEGIAINLPREMSPIHISLPSPIPLGDNYIYSTIFEEVKKKGELYEALKKYIILENEITNLNNKISCFFSSKRFYPETLKKEFPEAYDVYIKLFPEKEQSLKQNPCDSIESIRATLISNK